LLEAREEGFEEVGCGGVIVGEDVQVGDGEDQPDVGWSFFEKRHDFL
jgi:hypothetical protein